VWVNAYRENGRQQNKFSWSTLRANRENERPHDVKTAADMYAYRETADALHGRPAAFKKGLSGRVCKSLIPSGWIGQKKSSINT
jgi:hypothetical protein